MSSTLSDIPSPRQTNAPDPGGVGSRWTLAAGMGTAFVLTFLLRFTTARFGNDHFTHLSRARQILFGEWPIRDFFDPGQFLHYYLSAAAQLVFGYNLYGEALLTVTFLALAAALTFGVSAMLSRSSVIGTCAVLIAVIAFPRLYNYPKVFLYVAAIWLAWWYAHRPGRPRIFALAAFSVLAFLFRYDHGAYIGGMTCLLLVLVHAGQARGWRTAMAAYVGACCLLLLPFALYVHWAAGLPEYVQSSAASVRLVRNTARRLPDIRFAISPPSPPAAEPTGGDGNGGAAAVDGVLTRENALGWFAGITPAVPVLALLLGAWAWARGRIARPEGAAVVAAACLCVIITRTLVGNDPDARLADVASPAAALGAWVAGRWLAFDASHRLRAVARVFKYLTIALVFLVTFWSVTTQARFMNRLRDTDVLDGPRAAWTRLLESYRRLHLRPIDEWARPGEEADIETLARYVLRCTSPDDRLLIAGAFAPEVYFYAERGFAGGQVHFLAGWHDRTSDERLTIERMQRQSVPVVLIGEEDEERFRRRFSDVAAHIDTRYVPVPYSSEGEQRWRVLVERGRAPAGTDAELGLPCYRAPVEE